MKLSKLSSICLSLIAAAIAAAASASVAATSPTTISYYIDLAPSEFPSYHQFLAAYDRVGCLEASRSRGGLIMLDFGESRYSKPARQWGHNAWSPVHNPPEGLGPWMIDADMQRAVVAFARGLHRCGMGGDFYFLALGVNNNNYEPVSMLTAGKVWGQLVESIDREFLAEHLTETAWAIGGIDAEAGFGSVSDTVGWIHGYNEATRMSRYLPLLDFGDLECSFNRQPPACGSGWTLYWHWWVSWGNGHAYALPEIYGTYDRADHLYDAQKWRKLADFGVARTGGYAYAGVIAEQEVPPGHYDPLYALHRLAASEAHSRSTLLLALSTNITWCLLDDATRGTRHDTWCAYDGLIYAPPIVDPVQFNTGYAPVLFIRGTNSTLRPEGR